MQESKKIFEGKQNFLKGSKKKMQESKKIFERKQKYLKESKKKKNI